MNELAKVLDISTEQQKYLKTWNVDAYRNVSPGEMNVPMFLKALEELDPDYEGKTLIDFGAGTGRAAKKLDEHFEVTPLDFAVNCLDSDVAEHFGDRFVEHDLTKKTHLRADWGYCSDVLEHIPTEQIDDVLATMLEAADNLFFQIATIPDHMGGHPDIQEQLHLTVWDYDQWLEKFADHGVVVHRSMDMPHHVIFMVSGYRGFAFDRLKMNTATDVVFDQIRQSLKRGLKQLEPFEEQPDQKVIVLGGGPSLNNYIEEIKEHKANGAKIVTMNGTYGWAKEHDLWPVTQFMIDARPFNARFVDPVDEQNLFIISTQCHPDVFDKLPDDRTYLYQCNLDPSSVDICNQEVGTMYEDWFPIPGGSTVMLRTLPALFMLGFRDVEIYGFDSCFLDSEHHAFPQPENDVKETKKGERTAMCTVAGGTFEVEPWQLCQAHEFMNVKHRLLRGMNIQVHGPGLIAHCLEQGLDRIDEE